MNLTRNQIGDVIQQLYDSEINLAIGTIWDSGFDYSLDTLLAPLQDEYPHVEYTGERDIVKAFELIVADAVAKYPRSTFANWAQLHLGVEIPVTEGTS